MASYHYDESGNMAAYFIITFLALVLIPMTYSSATSAKKTVNANITCQCTPCVEQREKSTKRGPTFTLKSTFLAVGWSLLGYLCYKVAGAKAENTVYNPFEILALESSSTEKEIKSRFKQLSKQFHPDKVKATANQTVEMIQDYFVEITKAYKSLTDETIRENLAKYGHPDGRQELSMGIALPQWLIEGKNNIWVLGVYGLVIGGALPAFVGRWWFGTRSKTKDGVNTKSAALFFRSVKEDATLDELVNTLGRAFEWESDAFKNPSSAASAELDALEKTISEKASRLWEGATMVGSVSVLKDPRVRQALILLYAHMLRLHVSPTLQKQQSEVLAQTPSLLNALLNIVTPRNWLLPTFYVLRLQTYIYQALVPSLNSSFSTQRFLQLPGIVAEDLSGEKAIAADAKDYDDVLSALEKKSDTRSKDVKKTVERWGRVEIADASFKVAGESIVTPSSFVNMVVKLRITPPGSKSSKPLTAEEVKASAKETEEREEKFLLQRGEAEPAEPEESNGYAHAPHWPGPRKAGWWICLADDQKNRLVVPPIRVTDIPYSEDGKKYRAYKTQFQVPPNVGSYQWRLYVISDTYAGEEISQDLPLNIEPPSAISEKQAADDEISDPEEDTIAGQMAAMRGGAVKPARAEESEDESSTDDDEEDGDDSDSDSD